MINKLRSAAARVARFAHIPSRSRNRTRLIEDNDSNITQKPGRRQAMIVAAVAVVFMLLTAGAFNRRDSVEIKGTNTDSALQPDLVSSANAASAIANSTDMIVRNNVVNYADTLNAQINYISTEEVSVNKPAIAVVDETVVREVREHVVENGETVPDLAKEYDISSDTIRWANDLDSDALVEGDKLRMPPISGVFHKVAKGEDAESIAKEYKANADDVTRFNNAEVDGLEAGSEIFVPGGEIEEPETATPTQVTQNGTSQSSSSSSSSTSSSSSSSANSSSSLAFGTRPIYSNNYAIGYCTWHSANRRAQIGKSIPGNMGHAVTWGPVSRSLGYSVDGNPRAGDVAWKTNGGWGGYGHVAFVEKVNSDGTVLISEMNYAGGWNRVSTRLLTGSQVGGEYQFIH